MKVSENISLEKNYVRFGDEKGPSFGGSQMWFSREHSLKDRILHDGGCGLVASVDFLLYFCRKNGLKPKEFAPFLPDSRERQEKQAAVVPQPSEEDAGTGAAPAMDAVSVASPASASKDGREAYMHLLRKLSRFRYPIIPKAGSFGFEILLYINHFMRKNGRPERMHFLWKNTAKRRLEVLRDSMDRGYPVILIIGQRFFRIWKKEGIDFFRLQDGNMKLAYSKVRRHFVTITGMYFPPLASESMYLEITSWGKKYYISYEQLGRYISTISAPWISGLYYLK